MPVVLQLQLLYWYWSFIVVLYAADAKMGKFTLLFVQFYIKDGTMLPNFGDRFSLLTTIINRVTGESVPVSLFAGICCWV